MKQLPQELTKKWFKANIPDIKETKALKLLVAECEPRNAALSMPGDLKDSDATEFIGVLGKIKTEANKLVDLAQKAAKSNPKLAAQLTDPVVKKLGGYPTACKVAQNIFLSSWKKRDNDRRQAEVSANAAVDTMQIKINKAKKAGAQVEKELAAIAKDYGKLDDKGKAKAKKDVQSLYATADKALYFSEPDGWIKAWQTLRRDAAPEKFPALATKVTNLSKQVPQMIAYSKKVKKIFAQAEKLAGKGK